MFKQEKGFTLAEIVAGVIILMILATVVGLAVFGYIKDARVASLKEEAIAVENDLLTNAGGYEYESTDASDLGSDVRAVLGYHESKDTKLEGLVFEDKALRSEGEIHVGKLSMPEEELGNYDFSESGVKKMKGNGIGNEFYVYDELGQVESNVGLLGDNTLTLPDGGEDEDVEPEPEPEPQPEPEPEPSGYMDITVVKVAAGDGETLLLGADGAVYGIGHLRDDLVHSPHLQQKEFVKIKEMDGVKDIYAGYGSFAIKNNGDLYAWGSEDPGFYGLGYGFDNESGIAVQNTNVSNVSQVAESMENRFVVTENGTLYGWGQNAYSSMMNNGFSGSIEYPTVINTGLGVRQIASGFNHSLLLTTNGDVYSAGKNNYGQLGNTYDLEREEIKKISVLSDIQQVVASVNNSYALTESGDVYAWGENDYGQMGTGGISDVDVPEKITELSNIVEISSVRRHVMALDDKGNVFTWGNNYGGQIGDGNYYRTEREPYQVETLPKIKDIDAGNYHSVALAEDGGVYIWGDGSNLDIDGYSWDHRYHDPLRIN